VLLGAGVAPIPLEVVLPELEELLGLAALVDELLLPPQAASPTAIARAQAPARIRRCMRFTGSPLTWL
jgi:hypothetical protein